MKLSVFLAVSLIALAGCRDGRPVRLILDTDLESDVDDVGAIAVLHALADRGEVEILATMVSSNNEHSPACLGALNAYYGRPDLPIGQVRAHAVGRPSRYAEQIAKEFSHNVGEDVPDATKLYREILAKEPDRSVVFCTIGFLTTLRNLLESLPDEISDLDGPTLVARKVKLWVCMGGQYPKARDRQSNFKFDGDSAHVAVRDWPAPIAFCGYEIGVKIDTGSSLRNTPKSNPVRRAYELFNDLQDRHSWDQTAVLYAVRGAGDIWDEQTRGYNHVTADGANEWRPIPDKDHVYLIQRMPPDAVAAILSDLMIQPPGGASQR